MRAMTLRLQLLLLQAVIVCATTLATGVVAGTLQERSIRQSYQDRMQAVALSVASLPTVLEAFDDAEPAAVIQPLAELIRESSNVTYVVVTNSEGIRYSHPDPSRIGEMVSTDPSVPLSGETYVGTQTGTLGTSWRVKVPIFVGSEVIGTVSVGILESELSAEFMETLNLLILAMVASAIVGVFGAAAVTAFIRKRIYRLEPVEIASLVANRETTLHRLTEGVITVGPDGNIELINDAAAALLDAAPADLLGKPYHDVLAPGLLELLETGEPDGRLVLSGERVLFARSSGARENDENVAATILIRDHTELHALLRRLDGAQSLTDGLRAQAHEFTNTLHVVTGLMEIGRIEDARDFIARHTLGGSIGLAQDVNLLGDPELTALLSVKAAQAREIGIELTVRQEDDRAAPLPRDLVTDLLTVVGNLTDNAVEACRLGDRIQITASASHDSVRITVEDSGPGVPARLRGRVFSEGVSTKAEPGTTHRRGIGLALVARIVDRRRGAIAVTESALGGAQFDLSLPIRSRSRGLLKARASR